MKITLRVALCLGGFIFDMRSLTVGSKYSLANAYLLNLAKIGRESITVF